METKDIKWCPQHGYPLPCNKCGYPLSQQDQKQIFESGRQAGIREREMIARRKSNKPLAGEQLKEEITNYLTKRFISDPDELPKDECFTEANYILALIKEAGYQSKIDANAQFEYFSKSFENLARNRGYVKLAEEQKMGYSNSDVQIAHLASQTDGEMGLTDEEIADALQPICDDEAKTYYTSDATTISCINCNPVAAAALAKVKPIFAARIEQARREERILIGEWLCENIRIDELAAMKHRPNSLALAEAIINLEAGQSLQTKE